MPVVGSQNQRPRRSTTISDHAKAESLTLTNAAKAEAFNLTLGNFPHLRGAGA